MTHCEFNFWVPPFFPQHHHRDITYHSAPPIKKNKHPTVWAIQCPSVSLTSGKRSFSEPHRVTPTKTILGAAAVCTRLLFPVSGVCDLWSVLRRNAISRRRCRQPVANWHEWTCVYFHNINTSAYNLKCSLPEAVQNVSWQNVDKENSQADVEQDNHADHDGVWALKNKKRKKNAPWGW